MRSLTESMLPRIVGSQRSSDETGACSRLPAKIFNAGWLAMGETFVPFSWNGTAFSPGC